MGIYYFILWLLGMSFLGLVVYICFIALKIYELYDNLEILSQKEKRLSDKKLDEIKKIKDKLSEFGV